MCQLSLEPQPLLSPHLWQLRRSMLQQQQQLAPSRQLCVSTPAGAKWPVGCWGRTRHWRHHLQLQPHQDGTDVQAWEV